MASIRSSILRDMRNTYAQLGFAIPPDVDAALARDAAWSDAALLLRLHDIDGPLTAHEASRRNTAASTTQGAFAMLERQALKLFGQRPQAMMHFYPGAYAMAMRDVGTATYADRVSGGRILLTGVPSPMFAHPGFRAGVRGTLQGLLERLGWAGSVDDASTPAAASAAASAAAAAASLATSTLATSTLATSTLAFTMRWWRRPENAACEG
jgi:hypothetical protein